jgi:hypothetical protein
MTSSMANLSEAQDKNEAPSRDRGFGGRLERISRTSRRIPITGLTDFRTFRLPNPLAVDRVPSLVTALSLTKR